MTSTGEARYMSYAERKYTCDVRMTSLSRNASYTEVKQQSITIQLRRQKKNF
jgi:hypothetical protein